MTDDATKTPGRLSTERGLQDAALDQLRREGVLAGLNLSDVADAAGVNRGLVYHYFGSRRDLLRSALRRDARSRLTAVTAGSDLPLRPRMKRFIDTVLSHRDAVALTTLLVLDGDDQLRVMPLRAETRTHLRRDASQGLLDDDLDSDAVHATMVSLVWGYVLYREAFAREFGISATRLDRGVEEVFDRMLTGLEPKDARNADR
ncbi:MAG: hypothetical protein NVS3B12_04880 [Acidimicrobiales bacterium]